MRPLQTVAQIGTLIKAHRKHLKISQAELASRIGLSQNRLSVLESKPDSMTVRQMFSLLSALGLELSLTEKKSGKSTVEW